MSLPSEPKAIRKVAAAGTLVWFCLAALVNGQPPADERPPEPTPPTNSAPVATTPATQPAEPPAPPLEAPNEPPRNAERPPEPKRPVTPPSDRPPVEATNPRPKPQSVPLGNTSDLPWNQKRRPDLLPIRRLQHAREQLKLFGIDDSQLRLFADYQPWNADNETLIKILFRFPKMGLDDLQRWTRQDVDWDQVREEPASFRADVFLLRGRVQSVTQHPLLPEAAELFEFADYYQVKMQLEDSSQVVTICTRNVPLAWLKGQPSSHRASARALFLQVGESTGEQPELFFAAPRVAWHPDANDPLARPQDPLLGELGVDVGLIDTIPNFKPLGSADRECFYQFLAAAGKADQQPAFAENEQSLHLTRLLSDPKPQIGRVMTIRGAARRITYVVVNDPDIQDRFGIKGYYQIDGFLPLGDQVIRLVKSKDDEEAPEFRDVYPCTFCVLKLPEELQQIADRLTESNSQMELLNEEITVKGFFFKLWVYRSEFMSSFEQGQRQPAPMFIAAEPQVVTFGHNSFAGLIGGSLFLAALGIVWFGIWRYSRSDNQFERETLRRNRTTPAGKSLNDMGIEAQDEPDFSNL